MRSRLRPRRLVLTALLTFGLFAGLAGPAHAVDTIFFDCCPGLTFLDDPGEASTLTVTASPTQIVFAQGGGDAIDADNCAGDGTATVTCEPDDFGETEFVSWTANMEDLVDTVTASGTLGGNIFGNDGNDVLTGSDENGTTEFLDGEDNDDQINSRNVGPRIFPGGGIFASTDGNGSCCFGTVTDRVNGGYHNDTITTGNGNDEVEGDPCCVTTQNGRRGGIDPALDRNRRDLDRHR